MVEKQNQVYGPQRKGLRPGASDARHGRAQARRVRNDQEKVYIQVRPVMLVSF